MNTQTPQSNEEVIANNELSPEEKVTGTGENDTPETNDSDLTPQDFEALGSKDLNMDGGDDEQLKHRTHPVNFSGDDLDVPGSELDDEEESIGSEDEENNSYSIGGDNHEDLEEDPS